LPAHIFGRSNDAVFVDHLHQGVPCEVMASDRLQCALPSRPV
jgi:hypothetical protein